MNLGTGVKSGHVLRKDCRTISQGFVDIKNMTLEQLDEVIKRQNKLIMNRSFLEKLPDKGEKIKLFIADLEIEHKKKQKECDIACQLLSNLSLKDANVDEIEWIQGKLKNYEKQFYSNANDDADNGNDDGTSSDEKNDALKLIATHSGTANGKNISSYESKITIKNLNEVESTMYVDKFCKKYGKSCKFQERFKPNQLKNNEKALFLNSAVKVKKMLGNKWEVTQATPPVPVYNSTVMISLPESLRLQKEQAEKLKEIEKKHATEKLLENISVKMGNKLPIKNISKYRTSNNFFSESVENEKNEFSDVDNDN